MGQHEVVKRKPSDSKSTIKCIAAANGRCLHEKLEVLNKKEWKAGIQCYVVRSESIDVSKEHVATILRVREEAK
jgi:hypothetical protein